jgi:hypothetical protein
MAMRRLKSLAFGVAVALAATGCGGGSPAKDGPTSRPPDGTAADGSVADRASDVAPSDVAPSDALPVDLMPDGPPPGLYVAISDLGPAVTGLCAKDTISATCVPDSDSTAAGWQGTLHARVTNDGVPVGSGTVTFTLNGAMLGTSPLTADGEAALVVGTPGIAESAAATIVVTTSNIPPRGTATNMRVFVVDLVSPVATGGITVLPVQNEMERRDSTFRLQWTAPTDAGGLIAYDIRYQKMATGATDCAAFDFATAKPSGLSMTPGTALETATLRPLFIETDYCFAVRAPDKAGNSATLVTTTPSSRRFRRTLLGPKAPDLVGGEVATESFGYFADGSGDVNGDGRSDLILGTILNRRAYIIFGGGTNFVPNDATDFSGTVLPPPGSGASPSATIIQGTSAGFGGAVAFIGNFDGDGMPEIAVGAWNASKVFVFKGRPIWPATLTEAEADWVIQTDVAMDPGYTIVNGVTGSSPRFGLSLGRLGNFDGDAAGTEDIAIGAGDYPWDGATGYLRRGRVIIIRGAADSRPPGMSQATITLPEVARSIVIDGDMALDAPNFGLSMVSLGRYYSDAAGSTLVVGAPGRAVASSGGRIYAYRWQTTGGGTLGVSPPQLLAPAEANQGFKFALSLANLGPMGGGVTKLGIGNEGDNTTSPGNTGTVFVQDGDATSGPFGRRVVFSNSARGAMGRLLFGGSPAGTNLTYSIIGGSADMVPDLGIGGNTGAIYLLSGATALSAVSSDLASTADVAVTLPVGWQGTAPRTAGLIPDINGDGVADFASSDSLNSGPGRVVVFW